MRARAAAPRSVPEHRAPLAISRPGHRLRQNRSISLRARGRHPSSRLQQPQDRRLLPWS